MIAPSRSRGGERGAFVVESGLAVSIRQPDAARRQVRDCPLRYRRPRFPAREMQQPLGRDGQFVGAIDRPRIGAAARMNGRRDDDVTAIAANVDPRSELARAAWYGSIATPPDVTAARRERLPR